MIGHFNKIAPGYFSKICGTTGLLIFLLKDAFEYAGLIIDKRTLPSRLYKNHMYLFEILEKKLDKAKEMNKRHLESFY